MALNVLLDFFKSFSVNWGVRISSVLDLIEERFKEGKWGVVGVVRGAKDSAFIAEGSNNSVGCLQTTHGVVNIPV
jgi:hypothetical protein